MKPVILLLIIMFACIHTHAQKLGKFYRDSLAFYQQHYVMYHEVVKKEDKRSIQFFAIDSTYRVLCKFVSVANSRWFAIPTSSGSSKLYRKYGVLHFTLHDTALQLTVYQSQQLMQRKNFEDYLFIPFTDVTNGNETYLGGRYVECYIKNIINNTLLLDFNKAYNPYCAYATGFNCPIPPAENALPVAVRAGEKKFH
jgi:uncharacterized protein